MKHSVALAALVATSMSLIALPAFAQDQTVPVAQKADREIHRTITRDGNGPGRGAGILGLACSDKGAEALDVAFVRLSHRLALTTEQQPLFNALKTKALTTQTSFADTCKAALPAADATPDLVQNLKSRLTIEEARLTAMNALVPDLEAFYGTLTAEQKAGLMPAPHNGGPGDRMGRGDRDDRNGPGRNLRLPAPGRN